MIEQLLKKQLTNPLQANKWKVLRSGLDCRAILEAAAQHASQ